MSPAAFRLAALGGLTFVLAACAHSAHGAATDKATSSGTASSGVSTSASVPAGSTVVANAQTASAAPVRATPSRPGAAADGGVTYTPVAPPPRPLPALPTTRIKGTDYIGVTEIAVRLGFRGALDSVKRELALFSGTRKIVLGADKREVVCDGLRIFLGEAVQVKVGKYYVTKTDFERCLLSLMRPDMVPGTVPNVRTIVIDPGHGGGDPGMENPGLHLQEKALTLDVALRLEKLLKAAGYTVVLTRRDDRQLAPGKDADLQRRAIIANTSLADLFLSIHFNSLYPDTRVSGTEVYVFTRPGQRSDQSWGPGQKDDTEREVSPVNRSDPWSSLLAQSLHREVLSGLKTSDRGHKTKHLAALRGLNCPGVLIESLFISNESEARRAASPAYRQQIAESMAAGIRSYAATLDTLRPKSSATVPRSAPSNSP